MVSKKILGWGILICSMLLVFSGVSLVFLSLTQQTIIDFTQKVSLQGIEQTIKTDDPFLFFISLIILCIVSLLGLIILGIIFLKYGEKSSKKKNKKRG